MKPLAGKTILVTRAARQAGDIVSAIEHLGGIALVFPTIEILPPESWDQVDRALDRLNGTGGLVFTSANGAEYFLGRTETRGISPVRLSSMMVLAVGDKTRKAVERHGVSVRFVPEKFSGFDLQKLMEHEDLRDRVLLFPRGNLGDERLPEEFRRLGARVETVVAYRTVKPADDRCEDVRSKILSGKVDILSFTSPSTFRNFLDLFPGEIMKKFVGHAKIAAIGPVTSAAIEAAGFRVDIIPRQSTIESLVEAMAAAGGSREGT